jgi:hypothetical protein
MRGYSLPPSTTIVTRPHNSNNRTKSPNPFIVLLYKLAEKNQNASTILLSQTVLIGGDTSNDDVYNQCGTTARRQCFHPE